MRKHNPYDDDPNWEPADPEACPATGHNPYDETPDEDEFSWQDQRVLDAIANEEEWEYLRGFAEQEMRKEEEERERQRRAGTNDNSCTDQTPIA